MLQLFFYVHASPTLFSKPKIEHFFHRDADKFPSRCCATSLPMQHSTAWGGKKTATNATLFFTR